jgi:hypothetical protein
VTELISLDEAVRRVQPLDAELRAASADEVFTLVSAPSASLYRAANELSAFDRDLRRAAAALGSVDETKAVRPVTLASGRLEVVDAAAGSLDVLVLGVGVLQHWLLSEPMRALLTAATLGGNVRKLWAWIRRPKPDDPLARLTLRDAIETLKALEEIDELRGRLGEPSIELEVAAAKSDATDEPSSARSSERGAAGGAGHRIVQARVGADGTISLIVIE